VIARRLAIGEHGTIGFRERPGGGFTAAAYYRDPRGLRRRLEASAASKSVARRRLLARFEETMRLGGSAGYDPRTTLKDVAEEWHAGIVERVEAGRRSPTTASLYRHALDRHLLPELGALRLSELTTARLDYWLHDVRRRKGHSTAKLCRSVLSGVCGYAVRRDAMRVNPVRDVSPLESDLGEPARALTRAEAVEWLALLDTDEYARRMDLPDFVRFLLGTGLRIGEAVGARWDDVDLERGTLSVQRTIVRVARVGLVARKPKTRAGVRVLGLPGWLVDLLRARQASARSVEEPLFPDALGGYRDRNNVEAAFRAVRAGTAFEWVVPHTYRKTVATWMDAEGLSARTIADQLGHSRISMTQDVYMGRRAVDASAARVLQAVELPPRVDKKESA
jgi:integrase